nr:hypothetical protein [Tanacetum cinerariifolium]
MVGRQGGEVGRLLSGGRRGRRVQRPPVVRRATVRQGRQWARVWGAGGGGRRVRVVGPGTSPVGPAGEEAVGMRAVVGQPMVVGPGRGRGGPTGMPPLVPAPWAGPTGRRGRHVVRRPRDDEGVARPARVWCRGAGGGGRQVRVVGWGGRAGDEAGGRADSWRPAVVGRQGGEAGRLRRSWRGGGDRRVRVVGPGTWPVGLAMRHRRGGGAKRRSRPVVGRRGLWWAGGDAAFGMGLGRRGWG